ncbi:GTPase Era [Mollicutes bacterium LVI A0078]|nr:GTPase Era [Mollicutes bacterium LVI A0075]WOO90941.1 GTPase Era [Mollicutes bacterium LVI A0078]
MYKSGFVSIVGSPNAGKSTMLNALLGKKVSIVSDKVQTTRDMIKGVYHEEELQIVFLDTPGFHKPQNKLQNYMNFQIDEALYDIEAIVYVIDGEFGLGKKEQANIERLKNIKNVPKIAVVNKIDIIEQEKAMRIVNELLELEIFEEVIATSMKEKFNTQAVIEALRPHIPEGVQYYEKGQVSDSPEAFIISEIVREKVLRRTFEEVPHSIGIKVDELEHTKHEVYIEVTIYVERDSQKGIIIGKKAEKLKRIGIEARRDLQEQYGKNVYLKTHVKVLKNWRRKLDLLKEVGYEID